MFSGLYVKGVSENFAVLGASVYWWYKMIQLTWIFRCFSGLVVGLAVGCKSGPPSWAPPSPEQFPPPWERSNIRCGFVW